MPMYSLLLSPFEGQETVARFSIPESLYSRLDECVQSVTTLWGRYDIVTHMDSVFLNIFL